MSRLQLIISLAVAHYVDTHEIFGVKFLTDEEKEDYCQIILNRINKPNAFDCVDVDWPFKMSCPPRNTTEWRKFKLKDLDKNRNAFRIPIPEQPEDKSVLINWILGPYRYKIIIQKVLLVTFSHFIIKG